MAARYHRAAAAAAGEPVAAAEAAGGDVGKFVGDAAELNTALKALFAVCDADGSGKLDNKELAKLMEKAKISGDAASHIAEYGTIDLFGDEDVFEDQATMDYDEFYYFAEAKLGKEAIAKAGSLAEILKKVTGSAGSA